MKPSLNRKVYCIYGRGINETTVMFLGEYSFINDCYSESNIFGSWEHYYDDYGKTWFTSLKEAKSKLLETYPEYKIKKIWKNYWVVE
jgi:hypothetical protein